MNKIIFIIIMAIASGISFLIMKNAQSTEGQILTAVVGVGCGFIALLELLNLVNKK